MEQQDMKTCPYCAEPIKADAVKCRYCGSALNKNRPSTAPGGGNYWRRVNEGKRIAGVCTGIAREFNAPRLILPLRIFFILTTVFYGFGFITYIVLWLLMPSPVDMPPKREQTTADNGGAGEPAAREVYYTKETSTASILFGMAILVAGLIFLAAPILHGGYRFLPIGVHFDTPNFMLLNRHFFDIGWIASMFPLMILMGLMLLFFGVLKALRISIGCGMIALGSLLMLMFPALLPRMLFMPGLPLIGLLFLIIGISKLLFGSTRTVETTDPMAADTDAAKEGWSDFEESGKGV